MRFRNLAFAIISILLVRLVTPAQQPVVKSLERSKAQALKEAEPSLEKYTGRYFLTNANAFRSLTFREFAVSIVNQRLVVTVPDISPGSVVYLKETPLEPFGGNVFHVAGGSFYGNFMTFESNQDGSMVLKWRKHVFKRQP